MFQLSSKKKKKKERKENGEKVLMIFNSSIFYHTLDLEQIPQCIHQFLGNWQCSSAEIQKNKFACTNQIDDLYHFSFTMAFIGDCFPAGGNF